MGIDRSGYEKLNPAADFDLRNVTQIISVLVFENQMNFAQAIDESGIEIQIRQREYTLAVAKLEELDSLYASRSPSGRPDSWGFLVGELREIRRAVEAGVVVQVEDRPRIQTWQEFYAWAHGRYHMLEDGYDKWIGDDQS